MPRTFRTVLRSGLVVGVSLIVSAAAFAQAQQPRGRAGWPCVGKVDPSYVRTAEATGGKVFLSAPGEVMAAAEDMTASQRHSQTVLRISDQFDDEAREYTVPIDSTVESVYFFVSIQCLQSATIVRPNGEELRTDAPDVEFHGFQAIRLFTVKTPAPGSWVVRMAGRGAASLIASAKSELDFSLSIVEDGKPVSTLPVPGKALRVEARMFQDVREASFQFLSPNGAVKARLQLDAERGPGESGKYVGEVTPPNADYRLAVTGTDAHGFPYQRVQGRYFVVSR
jgi:hypothetical protein